MSEPSYPPEFIDKLELLWGIGFLSPGGPDEVKEILRDITVRDKMVLDIGCGTGGPDIVIAQEFAPKQIVGIDIEPFLIETSQKNIALFAAGSGITPVMSILKTALLETSSEVLMVYGNKSPEHTIFKSEIDLLQNKFPKRLSVQYVYSQSDEEEALFGRIDRSTVNYTLKNKFSGSSYETFYLCGPEEMIETVKSTLMDNSVDEASILFELFTSSASTENEVEVIISGGNAQITVMVDDEEEVFEMPKSKTILEAALAAKIDAPYSCQGGVCSSCIAKVKSGKTEMRTNNILTDSELEEGFILTCQAQPISDTIYIDYDDV